MRKITIIGLGLLLFLLFSCDKNPLGPKSYSVKYEVAGSASRVDITYENADGGTSQIGNAHVPWSMTFSRKEGSFVYISAQNQGSSGSITVTIYRNGSRFKTSTSSGAYVIATASGTL